MTDECIKKSDVRKLIDLALSYARDAGFSSGQLVILEDTFESACISKRISGVYDRDDNMKNRN